MSRKFQVKVIPSKWIEETGLRLDCGPYMSGAIEAREMLQKHPLHPLCKLVVEKNGGIFNGPRFVRIFVNNPEHGIKLISGAEMIQSDLSNVNLIAKSQVKSMPYMVLQEGITLVSSYGTIGRCCYVRSDMAGCIGSDNTLKIIPDQSKIKAGYLFSYLSSKYGVLQIIEGSGGSVVTFLDPSRVADLPVPRLGAVEEKAHELVQRAADLMVESSTIYKKAADMINQQCGFPEKLAMSARMFAFSVANSNSLFSRLDATFHNPTAQQAEQLVLDTKGITLHDAGVRGLESNRLKQIFVDEEFGTPFITSSGIFLKSIEPERFIRTQSLGDDEESWRINKQDILLARSGQVGGIIGRGVWADARFDGIAASPHIIRLRSTDNDYPAGYIFAFLCLTDIGYQLLARTAAGSSIPYLPLDAVLQIRIPTSTTKEFRDDIHNLVLQAGVLRGQSQKLERDAVLLVEQAIEEGGQ